MRKVMLIVAAAVLLSGCGKNETANAPAPAAQPAPAAATAATESTATTATTATTTAPAAAPAGAIASSEGEKPGMHIDVTELKRSSGGTVSLKFVLSNSGERMGMWDFLSGKGVSNDDYDVSGVTLIDPVNKKKYFVVTDTEKSCLCSRRIDHIDANSKLNLWAKFPAPPPDVTKVSIEIPHFEPIDDVPISQ